MQFEGLVYSFSLFNTAAVLPRSCCDGAVTFCRLTDAQLRIACCTGYHISLQSNGASSVGGNVVPTGNLRFCWFEEEVRSLRNSVNTATPVLVVVPGKVAYPTLQEHPLCSGTNHAFSYLGSRTSHRSGSCHLFNLIWTRVRLHAHEFRISNSGYYTSWLQSSFTVGGLLSSYAWGVFADKFGRKPVMIAGVTATGVFAITFGFSTTLGAAMASRFAQP